MNTAKSVAALIDKWKSSGAEAWRIAWSAALLCVDWPYVFGAWGAECTPAERKKRKRDDHPAVVSKCQVLNGSKSSCTGCRWFPGGETIRCFDCRGFTDWCLKQAGFDLKGEGATGQWNTSSNWLRKGDIATMPENTLVCLFVKNGTRMEHTGLGLNNETCECSSGVQHFTSRNKKWTHWAIPRGLYDGSKLPEPAPAPAGSARPTLRRGSAGDPVSLLQQQLIRQGYDCGSSGADGIFGKNTEDALKRFQQDRGLSPDGVCGPLTWSALENPEKPTVLYSVTVPHLPKYQAEALVQAYAGAWMSREEGGSDS